MTTNSLVIFTKAARMLAEADTIQKAKELKSLALTAADWARRKNMGEEAIQYCRSYALEAERKMGEMLKAGKASGELASKGRPAKCSSEVHLPDVGLTRKESAEAQRLAEMPAATFEAVKTGTKTRTQVRREIQREAVVCKTQPLPSGKYRVLYADPPWKYGDQLTENYGAVKYHYPSLTIAELCALPVADRAADDAVLFLWVTSPLLGECFTVINAWGFNYKASFVWDKIKHNIGHYNSVRHEFLLICTRGSCVPDISKLHDSVQSIERTTHSAKPEKFREIIEELYPYGKRLELFARKETAGWVVYGNQC